MAVKPIPDGFHTVTPYLVVRGVGQLLEFVQKAFAAEIKDCVKGPDGNVWHASFRIGDSMMMAGEAADCSPPVLCAVYLYVPDTDATYKHAIAAGATSIMEPANMFYGDRNGGVKDVFGNSWWIGTHIEDVSPEELHRRSQAHRK